MIRLYTITKARHNSQSKRFSANGIQVLHIIEFIISKLRIIREGRTNFFSEFVLSLLMGREKNEDP